VSGDDVNVDVHHISRSQRQNAPCVVLELVSTAEEEVAVVVFIDYCYRVLNWTGFVYAECKLLGSM
jgi:hypothetical protein